MTRPTPAAQSMALHGEGGVGGWSWQRCRASAQPARASFSNRTAVTCCCTRLWQSVAPPTPPKTRRFQRCPAVRVNLNPKPLTMTTVPPQGTHSALQTHARGDIYEATQHAVVGRRYSLPVRDASFVPAGFVKRGMCESAASHTCAAHKSTAGGGGCLGGEGGSGAPFTARRVTGDGGCFAISDSAGRLIVGRKQRRWG